MTTQTIYATEPEVRLDFSGSAYTIDELGTGYTVVTNVGRAEWVKAGATLLEGQVVYLTTNVSTAVVTAALLDTTISGALLTDVAIVHKGVASAGYGWVFIGPFSNVEVLTTTGITAGTQLTTHTVAGTASTGGDAINGLTPIETSVAGLTQCNAIGKLGTNI